MRWILMPSRMVTKPKISSPQAGVQHLAGLSFQFCRIGRSTVAAEQFFHFQQFGWIVEPQYFLWLLNDKHAC